METIRRQIHPEVRIVDAKRGIVDYVASDESVDSYREVIRANGWQFNLFKKNAPFVDSHDYGTIEKLIGKVVDFSVDRNRGRLINRVQWAIDVPDNQLAQLGWKMTESGYLKAVSVGFFPTKFVTATSAKRGEWLQQLQEIGLTEDNAPRTIYVEQEQIELSAVIIGANPNALLEAHKAGAITERDIEFFQKRTGSPIFQIPFHKNQQSSKPNGDMKSKILSTLARISTPKTSSFDDVRRAQRGHSDDGLVHALRSAMHAVRMERRAAYGEIIESILADPDRRMALNALARHLTNCQITGDQQEFIRALSEESSPGSTLIAEVFAELYNLLAIHGAWATLGARPLRSKAGKFPIITAYPNAYFIHQNQDLTEDDTFDGTSISADTLPIACLVSLSLQLLQDSDVDLSPVLLENFEQAFNQRLDTACFIGNGADDADNGGNTGIFVDATIPVVDAGAGNTKLEMCQRDDFLRVMEAVDAATLQRPCRWWLSSALLPAVLRCQDAGGRPLVTMPPESDGFYLIGSPITLTPVAPSTNAASQKVIAFGDGRAYAVGLRNFFNFESSGHAGWNNLKRNFRAFGSAKGKLRKKEGLAILKTAAQ